MHLHFRSRDKNGVHTIRNAVVESPREHADFNCSMFSRMGVIANGCFTLWQYKFSPVLLMMTCLQKAVYVNFVDFKKAFDSIHRDTLWKILQLYGIPQEMDASGSGIHDEAKSVASDRARRRQLVAQCSRRDRRT